jgi:hypothetical protein
LNKTRLTRQGRSVLIPEDVAARAALNAVPGTRGCLISTYSVGSHGYAQVGWMRTTGRGMTTAHRASWVATNGQIPDGMTVDHLCHVKTCVAIDHLRLLSNVENATDGSHRSPRYLARQKDL